jgi:hypothetical protein
VIPFSAGSWISQAEANLFGFDSLTAAEGTCGAITLQGNS